MKTALALRLSAATLLAASLGASADATFHSSNDEAGTVYHSLAGPVSKPVSADAAITDENWEFKGGDTGFDLRQHAYAFRDGRLAHADDFSHDSPRPANSTADVAARSLEPGGG